jgi:Tol biopolymer transport system component
MRDNGTDLRQLTTAAGGNSEPFYSPDGTKIVFESSRDGDENIYVMNSDGTNQVRLTDNSGDEREPQWTPDGNKIVFAGNRSGPWQVYLMNADGSNVVQITYSVSPNWEPTVSIDGTWIAFTTERYSPNQGSEVYKIKIDGTEETRITTTTTWNLEPSWPGKRQGTRAAGF